MLHCFSYRSHKENISSLHELCNTGKIFFEFVNQNYSFSMCYMHDQLSYFNILYQNQKNSYSVCRNEQLSYFKMLPDQLPNQPTLLKVFNCQVIFNVHMGPQNFSPLSEKFRHSTDYSRIKKGEGKYFFLNFSSHLISFQT